MNSHDNPLNDHFVFCQANHPLWEQSNGTKVLTQERYYHLFFWRFHTMLYHTREDGQGLSEYAFLLVLVAFILMGVLTVLGTQIVNAYTYVVDQLALI